MEFVIAKLVQIPRFEGKYDKDNLKMAKTVRIEHPVERRYAEHINNHVAYSGKYYDINESKSKKYMEALKTSIDSRRQTQAANELAGSELVNKLLKEGLSALTKKGGSDATN